MPVRSLGYVVIETRDLRRWEEFATEVLGVMPQQAPRDDVLLFRIDDRPFRMWIQQGEKDTFTAAGWELSSKEEYQETIAALRAAGHRVEEGDKAEAMARHVTEMARTCDPAGNAMELFYGRFQDCEAFASPIGVSGFVTGPNGDMGLGHIVLCAPNFDETHRFYRDFLGFSDTDRASFPLPNDKTGQSALSFAFLHARNSRHHSLALGQFPKREQGALHMMLEVETIADVGRAYDRAIRNGNVPVAATLGQHVNDKMVSFYMRTPSGFDIEYGCGGLVIDPDSWITTTSLRPSIWGHAREAAQA